MKKSIAIWGSAVIFFLLIIFFITINALAFTINSPDQNVTEYFTKLNIDCEIHRTEFDNHTIRYVETGIKKDSSTLIFFLHGAPGSWDAFKSYLADYDLTQQFTLVSMDRLGYGGSSLGISEQNLEVHAESAIQVIEKYHTSNVIIVSHSYGSAISAVIAAKRPDLIKSLVMCSPVIDPESEPVKWYAQMANWNLFRAILPHYVNVATDEKLSHVQALKDINQIWQDVICPVTIYHGKKDILAPFKGNVEFGQSHLPNGALTLITEEKGGHLLIWTKGATFKNIILDQYNKLQQI